MKLRYFQPTILAIVVSVSSCIAYSKAELPSDYKHDLQKIYTKYQQDNEGENATYIPELAKVNSNLFSITIVTVDGQIYSIGDSDFTFSLQSISKVFTYALALEDNDKPVIFNKIGLDATGDKFNSINSIEDGPTRSHNPFVNSGAIQTTSYIKGNNPQEKFDRVLDFIKALSDGRPYLGNSVYQSEMGTNVRNQAIAHLLKSHGMINGDPLDALDRYTKACSIMVTTKQLALMGATLANKGINPLTKKQIISASVNRDVLSQMLVNGLYEKSGTWFVKIGVPAKSGVSGGLLAIIPNKMAIAVFSSPLDSAGTSVRGQKVIQELSNIWGLHLLD